MGLFRASSGALRASGHLLLSLLESLSARLTISLDIPSTRSTNIFVPRNLPGYLSAFRMAEADVSFFSQLLHHSHLTVVLSTLNNTRFPAIKSEMSQGGWGAWLPPTWAVLSWKNAPSCRLLEEWEIHQLSKMADLDPKQLFPPWPGTGVLWAKLAYSIPCCVLSKKTASILKTTAPCLFR